jgi:hypothetical protein
LPEAGGAVRSELVVAAVFDCELRVAGVGAPAGGVVFDRGVGDEVLALFGIAECCPGDGIGGGGDYRCGRVAAAGDFADARHDACQEGKDCHPDGEFLYRETAFHPLLIPHGDDVVQWGRPIGRIGLDVRVRLFVCGVR